MQNLLDKLRNKNHVIEFLLKISAFCVLLVRGIRAFNGDTNIRTILWDESLITPVVNLFGLTMHEWASNVKYAYTIDSIEKTIGMILITGSVHLLISKKFNILFLFYFFVLSLIYVFQWKDRFYHLPLLVEHFGQLFPTLIYYLFINSKINIKKCIFLVSASITLTFVGHGFYAANIYPVPGKFIDMCILILKISEDQSRLLLLIAGILDLLCLPFLFIKKLKVYDYTIYYMLIWGFLTAVARIIYFNTNNIYYAITEFFVRTPHFILPLILVLIFLLDKKKEREA